MKTLSTWEIWKNMGIGRDLGEKKRRRETNTFLKRSFRLCILRQGVLLASPPLYFKSPLLKATFQIFTHVVRGLTAFWLVRILSISHKMLSTMEIQALRHAVSFCEAESSRCCLFGYLELSCKATVPILIKLLFLPMWNIPSDLLQSGDSINRKMVLVASILFMHLFLFAQGKGWIRQFNRQHKCNKQLENQELVWGF